MSRLRNRNIRTKIQAVTKWGQNFAATTTTITPHLNGMVSTTADSGIAEIAPKSTSSRIQKMNEWEPGENPMIFYRGRFRDSKEDLQGVNDDREQESSDNESTRSSSSVNTLKVLDEIRNLEDSVKTNSADSYNSWIEDYESNATQLVRKEYERMERVLQCLEQIPSNYDKDEYKLWIKTFPFLRLTSHSHSPLHTSSPNNSLTPNMQRNTNDYSPTAVNLRSLDATTTIDKVMDNFYSYTTHFSEPSRIPTTHTTTTYSNKDLAINNTINPRTLVKMDHSFLQLAPLNISSRRNHSTKPSNNNNKRDFNSHGHSSYSHDMTRTAEWLKDIRNLSNNNNSSNSINKNYFKNKEKDSYYSNYYERNVLRRKSSKTEPLKSSEFIVLPPIEGKELRSASAATIASLTKVPHVPVIPIGRLRHPVYPLYETERETDHQHEKFVTYNRRRKRKYQ